MKFICDKCGSTNVTRTLVAPKPQEPDTILMSQYRGPAMALPAVHYLKHGILLCQDCGYKIEYSHS